MFVNLHVHDTYGSLLDSILTIEQAVKFAKDNNQPAIALTNHGKMSSFVWFEKECRKQGIKPIHGNEVYEVDDMTLKQDTKDNKQQRYHLILLAKNEQGLKNLFKITSVSCTDGFYVKPRIDLEYIRLNNLGKGLICLTACQAGRLSKLLVDDRYDEAFTFYKALENTFDFVACELQSHGTDDQICANNKIYQFAAKYNLPYVITTDAHMLSKEDQAAHSIFVAIGEGREVGENYSGCYLQNDSDVQDIMREHLPDEVIQCGIDTTAQICDMIDAFQIDISGTPLMPLVPHVDGFRSNQEYLRDLVYKGLNGRRNHFNNHDYQERVQRIETELGVLFELNYTDYFIILFMLISEARKRNIPLGPGRGSACGCLCAYLLGITQLDSVTWDLDFSRFANLGRRSMADVDLDVSKRRRQEIITITEELFGKENVCGIATFNSLSTKVAIRDIGKVLNDDKNSPYYNQIPYSLRNEVCSAIPTIKTLDDLGEAVEKDVALKDVLFKNERLKAAYNDYPLWFKYVMRLEGLPKSQGRHAAGTLITPQPITEYCPVCLDKEGMQMCHLEMHQAMDDLGLIKIDFLGLKTLDVIDDTLNLSGLSWNDVDTSVLDFNDQTVYDAVYKSGNTIGIFQMESLEARRMCIDAAVDNIEDIIVVNAANRPGTKDSFPTYCFNKKNPNKVAVVHKSLCDIFQQSCSVLLYQEQALKLFRYAGFPENEVDNARRAIGKKDIVKMKSLKERFNDGLVINGWDEKQIDTVWALMEKQSAYCFNRSHAAAYGVISYITAYLKTHSPLQFMTACLINDSDNMSKVSLFINECRRMNIVVTTPNINKSQYDFTPIVDKNQILYGFKAIKGIGDSIIESILNGQPYNGLQDFIERSGSNKGALINLAKAGAFPTKDRKGLLLKYANNQFDASYNEKKFSELKSLPKLSELQDMWGVDVKTIKDKESRLMLYNEARLKKWNSEKQERLIQKEIKRNEYLSGFYEQYLKDEFLWEFETLGMFITKDPLAEASRYISAAWDDVDNGQDVVVLSVVMSVQKKKDKNGNVYCYLHLYTPSGVIEATCWNSVYVRHINLISKGTCISILGRKDEKQLMVKDIKLYTDWLKDRNIWKKVNCV